MLPVKRRRDREFPLAGVADFDHWLDRFWNWSRPAELYGGCDVDIWDDAEHVYVEAELPGINKDDLNISVENGVLTIQGEKKYEQTKKERDHRLQERYYGSFSRSFTLPSTVDSEKVDATLTKGVLKIVLNKRPEAKTKRIEVKVGESK